MFTHVMIGCNDKEAAVAFYDATFAALGIPGQHHDGGAFYGDSENGMFGVGIPRDGQPATFANGGTIGFQAKDTATVDAWYKAGMAKGGTDEGEPGRRDRPDMKAYGAYMRDPEGNKLCAFALNIEE